MDGENAVRDVHRAELVDRKSEANQLVRSCDDKTGYSSWKVYDRFNPKTSSMARRHQAHEDQGHAWRRKGNDAWESKVVEVKRESTVRSPPPG